MKNAKASSNKKKGSKVITVLLVAVIIAAACVLGFSAYKLYNINKNYKQAENYYDQIEAVVAGTEEAESIEAQTEEKAQLIEEADPDSAVDQAAEQETADESVLKEIAWENDPLADVSATQTLQTAFKHPAWLKYASLNWNYKALLNLCEDGIGYIYQENTMSYPIVQAEDNDKYLRHLINGEYSINGTIFVDFRFEDGLDSQYSIIYGHNMDDKSMFGSITSYKDEAYYKEHPTFEIYSGEDMYLYYVFAAFQTPISSDVFAGEYTEEEFLKLMEDAQAENTYEMNAPEITKDSVVTVLTTCIDYPRDYSYRYVVFLVRGEKLLPAKYNPEK